MCPEDDSHLTLNFHDHYVISPAIKFHGKDNGYNENALGEAGEPVQERFEYNSGSNEHFLTVEEIQKYNSIAGSE
jgi:UDP-N-acetylglucosamine 4,6-dehydratase